MVARVGALSGGAGAGDGLHRPAHLAGPRTSLVPSGQRRLVRGTARLRRRRSAARRGLRARPLRHTGSTGTRTRCGPGPVEIGSKELVRRLTDAGLRRPEGTPGSRQLNGGGRRARLPGSAPPGQPLRTDRLRRDAAAVEPADPARPATARAAAATTPPATSASTVIAAPAQAVAANPKSASITVPPSQGPPVLPRLNAAVVVAPASVGAAPAMLNIRAFSAGAVENAGQAQQEREPDRGDLVRGEQRQRDQEDRRRRDAAHQHPEEVRVRDPAADRRTDQRTDPEQREDRRHPASVQARRRPSAAARDS